MTLADYLSQAAAKPFAYGTFDCLLFLADWVREAHGIDVAVRWRGKYASEREASRLMGHYGGMESLIDFAVRGVLTPANATRPGDIAIVRPHGPNSDMGAIRTGVAWAALKHNGGLWIGHHRVVAAWSIGAGD